MISMNSTNLDTFVLTQHLIKPGLQSELKIWWSRFFLIGIEFRSITFLIQLRFSIH